MRAKKQELPFKSVPGMKQSLDSTGLLTLGDENPDAEVVSPSELQLAQVRQQSVAKLNNYFAHNHRKSNRRTRRPSFEFVEAPDNPWQDRYLLCADCERRSDYEKKDPRPNCNNSTLLEVDMTAPFTRDNVMAVSCELVQMIMNDVWVVKDKEGKLHRVDKKGMYGSFPVQVCCVCRKTSLDEGRKFTTCMTCEGAHYCSNACMMKHRFRHRASCTRPVLPYRREWGVRKELRAMRDEIYPLIKTWAIKAAEQHMLSWRKQPQKLLSARPRPSLPLGKSRALVSRDVAASVPKKLTMSKKRRPSRALTEQASAPSDETLLNLGLTREDFDKRNQAWLAKYEATLDERTSRITAVAARAGIPECISKTGGPIPEPPREEKRRVTLEPDAITRIEEAALTAPREAPAEPLWADFDEASPEKASRRRFEAVDPGPEELDRKPGVVYQSKVEKLAKKHKLRLSKEAVERLEAAGRMSDSFAARKKQVKPAVDQQKKDRMLL